MIAPSDRVLPVAAAVGAGRIRGLPRHRLSPRSPRSMSRPIPIRRRRSSRSSRNIPASRRRKSSATSPFRWRSRSPARPASPISAPTRCSRSASSACSSNMAATTNFVRQQVTNRLKDATLPPAVTPVISPAGGISEILRYQLEGSARHGPDPAQDAAGLGGGAQAAHRAGRRRRRGARRQDQGIPGRDRSRPHAGLRAHAAADHQRDLHQQRQCRRPHHRGRRAIGERARRSACSARSATSATSC